MAKKIKTNPKLTKEWEKQKKSTKITSTSTPKSKTKPSEGEYVDPFLRSIRKKKVK